MLASKTLLLEYVELLPPPFFRFYDIVLTATPSCDNTPSSHHRTPKPKAFDVRVLTVGRRPDGVQDGLDGAVRGLTLKAAPRRMHEGSVC